jgi:hypothetical protein
MRTQMYIYVCIRLVKQASYRDFMYLTFMFSYSTSKTNNNYLIWELQMSIKIYLINHVILEVTSRYIDVALLLKD